MKTPDEEVMSEDEWFWDHLVERYGSESAVPINTEGDYCGYDPIDPAYDNIDPPPEKQVDIPAAHVDCG